MDRTSENQYLKSRKKYRNLLEQKKASYKEKEWIEAKKDKSGKRFWEIINKQRNKRTKISEKIKMDSWMDLPKPNRWNEGKKNK